MVQRSPYFKKIKYRQHLLVQILATQKKLMGVATNEENIYALQGAAASLGSPLPLTAVHHAADCHPLFSLHIQLLDRIFFNKSITFELLNSFSFTLVTM
jgi:hypothetical protein